MKRILVLAVALLLVALVALPAGAAGNKPPEYFVDESKLPFEALPGATAYWGVHKGAGYRIEVPENWNGNLVMWAHGFRGTELELTVERRGFHPRGGGTVRLRVKGGSLSPLRLEERGELVRLLGRACVQNLPERVADRMIASGEPPPLIISNPREYGRVLDLVFEERPWIPQPMRRYLARQAAARFHHYNWIYRQIRTTGPDGMPVPATPLQPFLQGSKIPTLILWGDRDQVLDVSGASLLADAMEDARVEIMPGVGHLPMLEDPEGTAALYLEFLELPIQAGP